MMMKKTNKLMSSSFLVSLSHSITGITCCPPPASFQFHSHFLLFSTNKSNPNPKPRFPYSSNPTHANLQQLLLEKSKSGFDKLDDALAVFDKMLHMKPLPSVYQFAQLCSSLPL
ncbi:hypothetical protein POM88_001857 [Heracleum sosnowskyi]|uniref:Pentatricopeptide repeat-containing protein n=1 Tax=Heracleum sosnowskyi TaxID=360622 RepID=A0AAD8JGZ1_9APIA|nr:hypothetical protein POM88_001857 [Heracleum sosnowskyi]